MSSQDTTLQMEGDSNSPLKFFQPMNITVFLTFFSPIILATSVTGMSFIFQNFKGLIYLGFLLASCIIRGFVYMMSGASPVIDDKTICTSIQYTKYGNPTFSAFVFAFTIAYLSIPMFKNGSVNYWVLTILIAYFLSDIFIKMYKNCISSIGDLCLNILLGAASAALFVISIYAGGSGKHLFFNEISSNKEMCYQPSKQNFKCLMYKDGKLISEL
jgi:hypothetical protein